MAEGMDQLHKAISRGDLEEVKTLTRSGVDLNHKHGMQGTALCNSISSHQTKIAEFIIDAGCDVNITDYDLEPPLLLALRKEEFTVAKILIDHPKCDLDVIDPVTKQTALCFAAANNFVDIVEKLLESGKCNVKKTDDCNNCAMHIAVMNKHYEVLNILMRVPEMKTLWNNAGLMPIHIAAQNGDVKAFEILYPSESTQKHKLMEPLFGKADFESKSKNPMKDLNIRTRYTNDTALHFAVRENHRHLVEILLDRDVDVNAENNLKQTALLMACGRIDLDMVLLLLEHNADPNKPGALSNITDSVTVMLLRDRHISPLGAAAFYNNQLLAETLVQHGADLNLKDDRGKTALFVSLFNNSPDTALFLLCAAMEKGVDISFHNYSGDSLLHAVVKCSDKAYELTCFLIGLGCKTESPNRLGNMPIHEAIAHENEEVVRAIIDEGGSITVLDRSGASPMHLAALVGNIEIAKMLLSSGADINELSTCGQTPLFTALESEMVPFAQFLVRSGCKLNHEKYLYDDFDLEFDEDVEDEMPMVLLEEEETFQWFKRRAKTPQTLFTLSLERIRDVFRKELGAFSKMASLPLPSKLIERLFFRDEDSLSLMSEAEEPEP